MPSAQFEVLSAQITVKIRVDHMQKLHLRKGHTLTLVNAGAKARSVTAGALARLFLPGLAAVAPTAIVAFPPCF